MRNRTRRRVSGAFVAGCALTAPALLGVAHPAAAQEPASGAITLDLRDAVLEPAIQALKQRTGIQNIVVMPGRYSRINVSLTDVPSEKALRVIAEAAGAVVKFEDGIYYLRPRGEEPPKPAPKEEPVVVVPPKKAPRQTVKIPLTYLPPRDFIRMINDSNHVPFMRETLGLTAPAPAIQTFGGINAHAIASPTPVPAPNGGAVAGQAGQTSDDGTGSAGQRGGFGGGGIGGGGIGGGIGGGRGGNLGGLGGGAGGLGGGPGGAGQGNLGGGSIRPQDIDNIISSDADNTLIVQGTPQAIEELRSIVRLLDIAPKQVLIKAEFVSVGIQDAEAFGIDWKFSPSGNTDLNFASPALNAPPSVTMAYASGNAVAAMRAALTKSTNNLLQAPIISTTNNMPGTIQVQTTNTIFINQQVLTQFGSFTQTQAINIPTISGLNVLPHINGDNTISMLLTPQLQSQSVLPGPNGQPQFNIQTQLLTTFRRIKNGETMVLGGFIVRQEDKGEFRIPLLADLPIVGQLFTQKSKATNAREILVFITPTIIEDIPGGTGGAGPAL